MSNKSTPIIKDWFMLGMVTGTAASVAKTITNFFLLKAGFQTTLYGSIAAGLVLGKRAKLGGLIPSGPRTKGEWAIGYFADALLGGLFGAGLARIFAKTPPGSEIIKGIIAGSSVWGLTLSLGNLFKLDHLTRMNAKKMTTLLFTHILFGAMFGLVFKKFGTKLPVQSHPVLVKVVDDDAFEKGRLELASK